MGTINFKGNPISTIGDLPKVGAQAPVFTLTKGDLSDVSLQDLKGKRVLLSIFPSVDTPVCAASVRRFNEEAGKLKNVVVVCVSKDLPFAQSRFCGASGVEGVLTASDFRHGNFGQAYGVTMTSGPLTGLFSRAVVVIDESGKVLYSEHVPEIAQEPNYEAALKVLK